LANNRLVLPRVWGASRQAMATGVMAQSSGLGSSRGRRNGHGNTTKKRGSDATTVLASLVKGNKPEWLQEMNKLSDADVETRRQKCTEQVGAPPSGPVAGYRYLTHGLQRARAMNLRPSP
jgi:hypothetical protein